MGKKTVTSDGTIDGLSSVKRAILGICVAHHSLGDGVAVDGLHTGGTNSVWGSNHGTMGRTQTRTLDVVHKC